jgi:hypothetical protein
MLQYIVAVLAGVLAAFLTIALVMRFRARRRARYTDIRRWFKSRESASRGSHKNI